MTLVDVTGRFWRTIRWLRVGQIYWYINRRFFPSINPKQITAENHRSPIASCPYPVSPQPEVPQFHFCGSARAADVPVDWHPTDLPRLWRYHLHYFDYLHWAVFPDNHKQSMIEDWIAANPIGKADAWEPFTVSVRIVNWIKYFDHCGERIQDAWRDSLINQSRWLASNIEHHIQANHYLKNAKALIYAGVHFDGPVGRNLLLQGEEILAREIAEQFLGDGGHYERSLMIHCGALEDLLDLLNLSGAQPGLVDKELIAQIVKAADSASHFLEEMTAADESIPLFNDAAFGEAPEPSELIAYAQRVNGFKAQPRPPTPIAISMPDSGFFGYRAKDEGLLIDCGQMGPVYQPGHAHCDMLSFELVMQGRRVIVDTGTFGTEDDEHRAYLRGTAAHNTVIVNGAEQSEVWGSFRLGRRARPLSPRIEEFDLSGMRFSGAHTGFNHLRQQIRHERHIDVDFGTQWVVSDVLTGNGDCIAESYLHFAPGLTPREQSPDRWLVFDGEYAFLEIRLLGGCKATSMITDYFPAFGVIRDKYTLKINLSGTLPVEFGYRLIRR